MEDFALALGLIAGEHGRDASVIPMPLRDHREVRVEGLRVAFYDTARDGDTEVRCEPDVTRALRGADLALEHLGCEALHITRGSWARPESTSWDEWQPDGPSTLGADEVERHLFEWDRFRRGMLGFMGTADVILTPVAEKVAVRHGEPEGGVWFTAPSGLTGQPAVVVRCSGAADGRPVAVQVVAWSWREDVALAVARRLEEALGGRGGKSSAGRGPRPTRRPASSFNHRPPDTLRA